MVAAIEDTGYANVLRTREHATSPQARLENLEELVNAAVDYDKQEENGLRDFIDHAALTSDTDKYDRNAGVTLMTVHSAKGLEFPIVFLVGHGRRRFSAFAIDQRSERNLKKNAVSRMSRSRVRKKILYVTHAMRRRTYGEDIAAEPSQFLNEMPLELIEDLSQRIVVAFVCTRARSTRGQERPSRHFAARRRAEKPKNLYTGKTYNSADAVAEFFRQRRGEGEKGGKGERGTRARGATVCRHHAVDL